MNRNILKELRQLKTQSGFTMIELLVVIAVIGVLAVAVLSSINPIEQINKGRDTRLRSDAGQMLSATERYFAIHEVYPWNETRPGSGTFPYTPTATEYDDPFTFDGPDDPGNANGTWNWTYQLSDTQEVKPAYTARLIQDSKLVLLRAAGANESTYVCFSPSSYAFRQEAAKNCTTGTGTQTPVISGFTVCGSTTGAIFGTTGGPVTPNYICLP